MNKKKGFVQLIIMLLIAILALSYFGIDLEQAFTKPLFKKNLVFTWNTAKSVWVNYIYNPITGIFDKDEAEGDQIDELLNQSGEVEM